MAPLKPTSLLRRLGGFAVSLVFSTVVSLTAIPFIIVNLGNQVWGDLAFALASAAIFGILVAFGWGTVGAAMTAGTPVHERPMLYANSLVSRTWLFLFAAIPLIVVVGAVSSIDPVAAGIAALAYLMPFLGASWYFIGQSKPWRLFTFDVLPQGLGNVTGVIATSFVPEAWVYAVCLLAFNVLAVIGSACVVFRRDSVTPLRPALGIGQAIRRLKSQWHGVIAAGTGSINSNGPIIAVTFLAPAVLPVYALADKLFRFGVAGFGPVLQVIQGWIPEAGPAHQDARVRKVAAFSPLLGLGGGAALAVLLPWAAGLMSAGRLSVSFSLSIPFGVIFAGVIIAQIIGLACLIPIGKGKELAKSTAIGAGINIILMVILGITVGGVGVAWAVAAGELVVSGYQILVLRRYFAAQGPAGNPAPDSRDTAATLPHDSYQEPKKP